MKQLKSLYTRLTLRFSPAVPKHLKRILSVEGQISPAESLLLFEMASQVDSGCIVEVGSYRGRSTVALALGSQAGSGAPVYAIDPHEPFEGALGGSFGPQDRVEFFKNVLRTGVGHTIRLVNLDSAVVSKGWDRKIALLWIDGNHEYEAVKKDFECWEPFVIQGGIIAFHDSTTPDLGPARVIADAIAGGSFTQVQQIHRTTVLQKQ
ncbi:MAG: class I SAM-dependent methyltransferase [Anaerolineae bacterium]